MFEIGNSLREARLRQGLDFPTLEQATKIRAKYLRALEDEHFESLPAQTYIKGFLRTYSEYLGLDGQLYVDEYNSRYVTGEEEPPQRPRRSARPARPRGVESRSLMLALSAIGIVTALVIAAWKFGGTDPGDSAIRNLAQPPAPTTAQKRSPGRPERPAGQRRARPVRNARLLVKARYGDSWIQVNEGSATGKQLFAGTLELGGTQGFERRRLWLTVGRPSSVEVRLNGRVRPLAGTGDPAVVIVTAKGIRAAPAAA